MNTNRRRVDLFKVSELAESINNIGLINPISVTEITENRFKLITGLHRLEAYKKLNLKEIPVNIVDACDGNLELMEINDNLIRNEIHFIDRGDYFNRRDAILTN